MPSRRGSLEADPPQMADCRLYLPARWVALFGGAVGSTATEIAAQA
jgi:hypothetical protein